LIGAALLIEGLKAVEYFSGCCQRLFGIRRVK